MVVLGKEIVAFFTDLLMVFVVIFFSTASTLFICSKEKLVQGVCLTSYLLETLAK